MLASLGAISQVMSATLGRFQEKNMTGSERVQKCPKQARLKVIMHDFRLFRGPGSEHHEMPYRDMEVHWK